MARILPGIIAMAAVVLASNILVQFLLGNWLTWGAFTYPVAFLVTDVMNRVYGPGPARKVVLAGFVVGVVCSLVGSQIMLEGDGYTYAAVSLRVAVGSGVAFLAAQLLDVGVFNALRRRQWWLPPLASTLVGSAVDTALFFTIAFSATLAFFSENADAAINWAWEAVPFLGIGAVAPLWVSLAFADWLVKLSLALVALVPFRMLVTKLSPDAA
ncbi:queuosine precursor transporter [Sinisalibacter aestuarii]|uniref:Probable queuosine precursor transporter n=1 Tax=Sinisalibacter aestuarii TaxID=2949426 RepID=A0ABQ5LV15_9RHOB|nr:queuosine precursor transporter [Sinisalibacter aestuarii]GKY88827.1 membrane protein [Sinisalibacter aestuarii]